MTESLTGGRSGKSQEQRIKDAAAEYKRIIGEFPSACPTGAEIARLMLEAADREPPKWPTDESMRLVWGDDADLGDEWRSDLRSAFLADPVIQAAMAMRGKTWDRGEMANGVSALLRALTEAGL